MNKTLLVRPPSSRMAEGQITHIDKPTAVSHSNALKQWAAYVDIYRSEGWTIVEVPVADDCPDCVFIEDTVVMFGNSVVITAPGTATRAAEPAAVEKAIREALPHITVHKIEGEGTLDGGDVLKVGKDVYVGLGGRTNAEGIRQLRRIVHAEGYTLHAVPVTKALHLSEYMGCVGGDEREGNALTPRVGRHGPPRRHRHRVAAHRRQPQHLPPLLADSRGARRRRRRPLGRARAHVG